MTNIPSLTSDEKHMGQPGQFRQLVAELHELEAETFEVEDAFDMRQNAPTIFCSSCCSSCCSESCLACSCSSTAAILANEKQ